MSVYPGSKKIEGVYQKIINEIPACKNYYELFAGSAVIGQIIASSTPQPNLFFNDIDSSVLQLLKKVPGGTYTNWDAIDIIHSKTIAMASTDTFVFLDPPYLHSCRPNNTSLYKFEMSETDHIQLLKSVRDLKCNCMIIHPVCALYEEYLTNYRKVQLKIRYNTKTSLECLYMNYPEVGTLQNYSFVGSDCWDRQRIKRKGERILQKLLSLPAAERNYILEKIKFKFFLNEKI